ncbi:hypothetical protein N8988_06440 [Opitutales bacterium]|nr:hypothetical protein [Opitutales bacterium]
MPTFRPVILILCLNFQAMSLAGNSLDEWFSSPLLDVPVRMDELSGDRIVELTAEKFSTPLFYPKSVSVFERMDGSLPKFYLLEQLAKNPGLIPLPKKQSTRYPGRFGRNQQNVELTVADRERQLFDTSLLLVPKRSSPLPSDDDLKAFLAQGRRKYVSPVDSKDIIDNLLKDEYADHPVISLLNDSPEVKKVLKSESFNRGKQGLFNSASTALQSSPTVQTFSYLSPLQPPASVKEASLQDLQFDGRTFLTLQARKPSRDGTMQPAQASEIYLTTQGLKELLKGIGSDPVVAGEVRSVAEMWAKAEKNVSQNPEIALGVKSILLSAKVGRARTDPYGNASMDNVSPDDKYFVIGIDKDVETNVVTIWSKEVDVEPGENLVELSSTDVIYQE